MQKLLSAYRANPTLANALKIFTWNRKHPFAAVLLPASDNAILKIAVYHATTGKAPSWQVHVDAALDASFPQYR